MSFCNNFLKFTALVGFFYFIIIGLLAFYKFEPLKINPKDDNNKSVAYAAFITSGVSFYNFNIYKNNSLI